jgi:predicted phosphoadenosine phosphosulfate sulfurtransferase
VRQKLLQNKYFHSHTLSQVQSKPSDSPFWKGLMKVKAYFFSRGSFKVGNGLDSWLWEDFWLGDKPLAQQYPSLYDIVQHKDVLVANVLIGFPINIAFRRNLTKYKWKRWLHLLGRLVHVNLSKENDTFVWNWTAT